MDVIICIHIVFRGKQDPKIQDFCCEINLLKAWRDFFPTLGDSDSGFLNVFCKKVKMCIFMDCLSL